ncbi:hypothetical protein O7632_10135 [Solwaraspora sp. WMMD406]|uniref:hypothetical protein n=1 Tax=Solwaraspora sp. WMMD406 TaxID=3016095 RepID=UPI00241699E2|nr:hypothetical protein [Solwaraspora sp. WMMD406]MDG4764459.1 hypothetical protein [Solwaraspora sp. WMMD406]
MTSIGSVARRSWQSFVGTPLPRSASVGRGREGYGLWRRVWASVIGRDLIRVETAPVVPRVPSVVRRRVTGWFGLPTVPTSGALAAAGEDGIVLEASPVDGSVLFLVRGVGFDYRLEVVLRGGGESGPVAVSIRYATVNGGEERELIVPMFYGSIGPSAGYVRLPGFGPGAAWTARGPEPVVSDPGWSDETVTGSIRAAHNEATRQAWRRIGAILGGRLGGLISEVLR